MDSERFRQAIARGLGLALDESKLGYLGELLRRRVEATGLAADAYLARLEQLPGDELTVLAQELTVPETYFFRNLDQFHALAQVALPERIRAQGAARVLRLLSAGCATGEEPYSLAIVARGVVPDPSWQIAIRAIDVNPTVLERAARGRYTSWSMRETPPEQRRWFRTDGRELVLDDAIRGAVDFFQRNLTHDDAELWAPATYDVVFCRNVLMYFTPEHARAVVGRIARALVPGGYLFLGHAETLRGLSHEFHLCHTHGTFYYQRKGGAAPVEAAGAVAPSMPARVEDSTSWIDAIRTASDKIESLTRPVAAAAAAPPRPRRKPDLDGAFELLRTERFADALDEVHRLPPELAGDPDALILEAVLLTHRGRIAEAAAACGRLLAIDELCAGAHYVLALCREAEGDHRGAADHDQVAVYLDPGFAMPRLHLGLLARRSHDHAAARRELGQALVLLQREDASRVLLFGGGFGRAALVALCAAELQASGSRP